jgi:hypothetical protein
VSGPRTVGGPLRSVPEAWRPLNWSPPAPSSRAGVRRSPGRQTRPKHQAGSPGQTSSTRRPACCYSLPGDSPIPLQGGAPRRKFAAPQRPQGLSACRCIKTVHRRHRWMLHVKVIEKRTTSKRGHAFRTASPWRGQSVRAASRPPTHTTPTAPGQGRNGSSGKVSAPQGDLLSAFASVTARRLAAVALVSVVTLPASAAATGTNEDSRNGIRPGGSGNPCEGTSASPRWMDKNVHGSATLRSHRRPAHLRREHRRDWHRVLPARQHQGRPSSELRHRLTSTGPSLMGVAIAGDRPRRDQVSFSGLRPLPR